MFLEHLSISNFFYLKHLYFSNISPSRTFVDLEQLSISNISFLFKHPSISNILLSWSSLYLEQPSISEHSLFGTYFLIPSKLERRSDPLYSYKKRFLIRYKIIKVYFLEKESKPAHRNGVVLKMNWLIDTIYKSIRLIIWYLAQ